MDAKLVYSVPEAKKALGIGNTKFYDLLKDGALRSRKIGRRTVIAADDLHAFIAALPVRSSDATKESSER